MEIKTGIYNHYKGGQVLVLGLGKHSDTDEPLVIYIGIQDKKYHLRPLDDFNGMVTLDGKEVSRFSFAEFKEIDLLKY